MALTDLFPTPRPSRTVSFIIGVSLILFIYFFTDFKEEDEDAGNVDG